MRITRDNVKVGSKIKRKKHLAMPGETTWHASAMAHGCDPNGVFTVLSTFWDSDNPEDEEYNSCDLIVLELNVNNRWFSNNFTVVIEDEVIDYDEDDSDCI